MSNRKRIYSVAQSQPEINISPLIDIVFILLIFFIVTTVFVEETGVEVTRPKSTTATLLDKNAILIAITDDERVIYGGQEIGIAGVRSTVRRILSQQEMPVIIQADKTVSVDLYARVYDEAQLGGATQINMATKR